MDIQVVVDFLIQKGAEWVRAQRDLHRPTARPLTTQEKADFAGFFDAQTLDSARIKNVPVIQNPEFYGQLTALGVQIPVDFTRMAGITFEDTILLSTTQTSGDGPSASFLFHELVHVVQYETLGLQAFVQQYIQGWAQNGFEYAAIPLERDAYELQSRYESLPQEAFSVRAEVRRRLGLS
jgi:hypothetical protein